MRDVATLLRSIDHVGSAAARRADGADPSAWIERTRRSALDGYEREAGAPADPALLHALEIVAECRELVYTHRVVPEWAYVARAGLIAPAERARTRRPMNPDRFIDDILAEPETLERAAAEWWRRRLRAGTMP